MLVVGLTGGIASGKSTVACLFAELGADIIDTDLIARQLVEPGSTALEKIVEKWGLAFLTDAHELDRRKLRHHIFNDPEAKKWLEDLLHPAILQQVKDRLALCQSEYCIIVVPLLAEAQQTNRYDFLNRICVIDCEEKLRIARLAARDQLTPNQAKNQIQQQATRAQRLAIANDIIRNDLDEEHLKQQVQTLDQAYRMLDTQ